MSLVGRSVWLRISARFNVVDAWTVCAGMGSSSRSIRLVWRPFITWISRVASVESKITHVNKFVLSVIKRDDFYFRCCIWRCRWARVRQRRRKPSCVRAGGSPYHVWVVDSSDVLRCPVLLPRPSLRSSSVYARLRLNWTRKCHMVRYTTTHWRCYCACWCNVWQQLV